MDQIMRRVANSGLSNVNIMAQNILEHKKTAHGGNISLLTFCLNSPFFLQH